MWSGSTTDEVCLQYYSGKSCKSFLIHDIRITVLLKVRSEKIWPFIVLVLSGHRGYNQEPFRNYIYTYSQVQTVTISKSQFCNYIYTYSQVQASTISPLQLRYFISLGHEMTRDGRYNQVMIGVGSTSFQKASNLEKQLKMTSTENLMSYKVKQLRHPNFQ